MAKTSYLNLTNKVLRRIHQDTIADVSTATGKAAVVTNAINEAQIELHNEDTFYSLITNRSVSTVAATATYAVASDFGRALTLVDTTNNRTLIEDGTRSLINADPDQDTSGPPTHFAIEGANYRLWPVPDAVYSLKDYYVKIPTTLSSNTDTSDLPIECENFLWKYAHMEILMDLNNFERADRVRRELYGNGRDDIGLLGRLKRGNRKILDRMFVMQAGTRSTQLPLEPPSMGPRYPRIY